MLSKIRIRNFRSISDLNLDLSNLNILIGRNDAGKSNILRALNLFFNNETDYRVPFDFPRDFSAQAITGQGKAQEVRIDLTLEIPNGYQAPENARYLQWTRRWRSDNDPISEDPVFLLKGNRKDEIGGRSRIGSFLRSIDYHYIPALKGREFFSELLADIYDVLSEVSEVELMQASAPLQEEVTEILGDVAGELATVLRAESNPRLPANLRSVFRLIQFESEGIDLDRRGDGIRVRHVPSLVKFLCDLKAQRSGPFQTLHIWGLEEPENSVDFVSAFDLRSQIFEISQMGGFQILMSTHSPVFFQLDEEEAANTLLFSKSDGVTNLSDGIDDLSKEMGVLRVVSPYVERSRQEADRLQEALNSVSKKMENDVLDPSQRVVFVEGDSDVQMFSQACDALSLLRDVKFISTISEGNSSAHSVADNLVAWHFLQKSRHPDDRVIGVGLVDADDAGEDAAKILHSRLRDEKSRHVRITKILSSKSLVHKMVSFGFAPKITMENLAPIECWEEAYESEWLERKSYDRILKLSTSENRESLLNDGLSSFIENADIELIPIIYDVKRGKKKSFSTCFERHLEDDPELWNSFKPTLYAVRGLFSGKIV